MKRKSVWMADYIINRGSTPRFATTKKIMRKKSGTL